MYDHEYEGLYGIRRLRLIISSIYLRYFPRNARLLELNCGTGTDATFLAQKGLHVLATDLSPLMIEEVEKKVTSLGMKDRIRTKVMAFDDLSTLQGLSFDGVYSNMGGLNCTRDLESIEPRLAGLVKKDGYFIATVMPDFCLWETMAFLARFRFRDAFRRRFKEGCAARLHGGIVRTFYHRPGHFARTFSPHFEVVELMGLNILTPPPNSPGAYRVFPSLMNVLERVESSIEHSSPFRSIGDHYVIVMRRKSS